tara:strand:+ start:1453 stop:1593 length:141 start_codon:yes stop_codon:yes gene_type:complete
MKEKLVKEKEIKKEKKIETEKDKEKKKILYLIELEKYRNNECHGGC